MLSWLLSSPWAQFLLRRGGQSLIALALLVFLTFMVVQLVPGDPARVAAGMDASADAVELARAQLGLDLPLYQQLYLYLQGLLTGDMGTSFRTGEEVTSIIAIRLPFTLSISIYAIVLSLVGSVVVGFTVAGLTRGNRNRWLDISFSWATAVFQTLPGYVLGALLVVVFAVTLRLLPAAGAALPESYVLPTIALALAPTCAISRVVRREAAVILEQDYIRTTRGWRIGRAKQYFRYALPNIMASTLTLSGLVLSGMLGGAIIIERVFAWPGLGNGVINAIIEKDFPVIRGIILTVGILAILLYLAIDLILAAIDPRTLNAEVSS